MAFQVNYEERGGTNMMLGRGAKEIQFSYSLPKVTKYLLAELIEERRGWMLQSQSAALKLFIGLEACQTYPLSDAGTLLQEGFSSFLPPP